MDDKKRNLLKGLLQGLRAKKGHKMFDKKEDKESVADELKESPAQQAKEKKEGTEQHPKRAALALIVAKVISKKHKK